MSVAAKPSASSGRERLVETAYHLFSQRGFGAVSLADIAGEVGLTKQAIIYHFSNKNALYAEVLAQLAARFAAVIERVDRQEPDAEARWPCLMRAFLDHAEQWPDDSGLIARELLDNRDRAQDSHRWYLRDFLDALVERYAATARGREQDLTTQRVMVYRQLGAITYLVISEVTLGAIWGGEAVAEMQRVQRDLLQGDADPAAD